MEDIITDNYYRVLGRLIKSPDHVREISRKIGLSHTQVGKILNYFYDKGILIKKKLGKTIIYELVKNLFSLEYLSIWNKLQLIDLMKKDKKIKIIFNEFFEKFAPLIKNIDCLILFGSYSKGLEHKSSDIDLFFISDLNPRILKNKIKEIEDSFGIKINIKILTMKDFEKEISHPLSIEVLQGIPLINSEIFYELKWRK